MEYKNTSKKMRILSEKAESMTPPLTRQQLEWIHTMRTRFGRLTRELQKSGSGAKKPRTVRDWWILQLFNFMGQHTVLQKPTKNLGMGNVSSTAIILIYVLMLSCPVAYMFHLPHAPLISPPLLSMYFIYVIFESTTYSICLHIFQLFTTVLLTYFIKVKIMVECLVIIFFLRQVIITCFILVKL